MPSPEIQNMFPQLRKFFAEQPVTRAYLFGSCARGEETTTSDVDILVTLDPTQRVGLLRFCSIMNQLEDLLHRPVDLIEEEGLKDFAKPSANRDKILLYERNY